MLWPTCAVDFFHSSWHTMSKATTAVSGKRASSYTHDWQSRTSESKLLTEKLNLGHNILPYLDVAQLIMILIHFAEALPIVICRNREDCVVCGIGTKCSVTSRDMAPVRWGVSDKLVHKHCHRGQCWWKTQEKEKAFLPIPTLSNFFKNLVIVKYCHGIL